MLIGMPLLETVSAVEHYTKHYIFCSKLYLRLGSRINIFILREWKA